MRQVLHETHALLSVVVGGHPWLVQCLKPEGGKVLHTRVGQVSSLLCPLVPEAIRDV